jgi:hypothetical protein
MQVKKTSFSIEAYALSVLEQLDLGGMNTHERERYLPRLVQQIEYRLGAALLPLVPDTAAGEFETLMQTDATPDAWLSFWQTQVPNFSELVQKTLHDFVAECKTILS